MTFPRVVPAALLAAASSALAVVAGFGAFAAGEDATEMLATGRYQLVVDGERDASAVFFLARTGSPRLLVEGDSLPLPVLFTSQERRAEAVAVDRVVRDEADLDRVTLQPGVDELSSAPMKIEGRNIKARVAGLSVTIEPRDAVVGEVEAESLLSELPEYRRNSASYEPGIGDVKVLAGIETATTFDVYFGSWCPHCERVIPRLIRVIEEIDNSNLSFRFRGLPTKFMDDPMARQYKVTALPTVVMMRDGQIVARLEGPMLHTPESALTAALTGLDGGLD